MTEQEGGPETYGWRLSQVEDSLRELKRRLDRMMWFLVLNLGGVISILLTQLLGKR